MNLKSILSHTKEEGWHINEEYIEEHLEASCNSVNSLIKQLLNLDLKDCGLPSLSNDPNKGKSSQLQTPLVVQISNIRNVSAPKANEESGAAPRLLKVTLTDGTNYIHGVEIQPIKSLSLKTPPGTKIKLVSKVSILGGFLLLTSTNTQVLGGEVEDLYKKWQMSQSASKYSRTTSSADGSGPPSWVPFGHKIMVKKEDNFKALRNEQSSEKEDEFESQRKQVVQEISQGSSQKIFGGGKQMLDSNVKKVVNAGFTIQEAEWALKRNKNDAYRAIQDLRGNSGGNCSDSAPQIQEEPSRRGTQRGRGRGNRGRGRGGPDDSDEDDYVAVSSSSRPSGPASLLDYLESRILDKKEPSSVEEFGSNSKPFNRERGGGRNYGRRGSKTERGKAAPKNQGEIIMSENWPSLQRNTEPEPVPKRDPSPNPYDSDNDNSGPQNREQSASKHVNSSRAHEPLYYQSKTSRDNNGYKYGNWAEESQAYQDNIYQEKQKYADGNRAAESKNYRGYSNNDSNIYNGTNNTYNEPKNYRGNSHYEASKPRFENRNQSYQTNSYRESKPRYESGNQAYESQSYQERPYSSRGRKEAEQYSYYNDERQSFKNSGSQYNNYKANQDNISYQNASSPRYESTRQAPDGPSRTRRPDQPIFIHSRGSRPNYIRNQDYSYEPSQTQSFQKSLPDKQDFGRNEIKERSAKERELIAQFEKSMVIAGCYEPTETRPQIKQRPYQGNYNSDEYYNRSRPVNDYQSQEFYGTMEFNRGGGFSQRRGGPPRFGRGNRY